MRPEFTVPRANSKAVEVLDGIENAALPEVTLPDMPEMPEMPDSGGMAEVELPEEAAPMFPELEAPENFPAQAAVDFADLPMGGLPEFFDLG